MEDLLLYLIKVSGLISLFYFAYMLLLRKETFFNSNRWFLILGLISAAVLPLFFITKIIWVEPTPNNFDWSNIPVTTSVSNPEPQINWYLIGAYAYFTGILISFLKLVFDFYSLIKVLKGKTIQQEGNFKFIDIAENIAPFSYFNYIVYNSALYSTDELQNILEHEKVHSQQKHSLDVLLSRLFCVFFWFNPLIWLYKKAIVQNLEFIADSEAAKKITDKKAYQFTLLKITTQQNCVALTNHFYQSLIKKRIIMLNQNESKKWHSCKYAIVFPALIAFVLLFQIKVVAQEKEVPVNEPTQQPPSPPKIEKSHKIDPPSPPKPPKPPKITDGEIYIDGVKSTNDELEKLDKNSIEKIDVNNTAGKKTIRIVTKYANSLKENNNETTATTILSDINNSTNIDDKKTVRIVRGYAIDSQGNKNSATTISVNSNNPLTNDDQKNIKIVKGYVINSKDDKNNSSDTPTVIIKNIDNSDNSSDKNAIIIIDGKVSNSKKMDKLNPAKITKINVQKFSNASQKEKDEAIQKYGDKALNGIIKIDTK
jgi:hypothetical protein